MYGENCKFSCLVNCVDLICDYEMGVCNGCKNGFKGNYCELNIILLIVLIGNRFFFKRVFLNFCVNEIFGSYNEIFDRCLIKYILVF